MFDVNGALFIKLFINASLIEGRKFRHDAIIYALTCANQQRPRSDQTKTQREMAGNVKYANGT